MAIALAELRTDLERRYRSTFYCASDLHEHDKKLRARFYCGYRWCVVCNRIRTAKAIDNYRPILAEWADRCFVTLTIPNVAGDALAESISAMLLAIPRIARAIRRTDGLPFRALRKLECTFNPIRDDFHPHLHLIVEGRATADAVVRRWLAEFSNAASAAQNVRPCDEGDVIEAMKYFTKLTSKVDKNRSITNVRALDQIFRAMKGKRVFQPMGFRAGGSSEPAEETDLHLDSVTTAPDRGVNDRFWEWSQVLTDWIDFCTGEVLSGYQPSARMTQLTSTLTSENRTPASTHNHPLASENQEKLKENSGEK